MDEEGYEAYEAYEDRSDASACLAPLMYLYRVCVSPGYTSPPAANLLVFTMSTCLRVYVLWSVWPVYVGKVQWLKQEQQSKIYIYLFMHTI